MLSKSLQSHSSVECPHIDYRFFHEFDFLLSFVFAGSVWEKLTFCNMPLPSYPFTLTFIDLTKSYWCQAAVTQMSIWCRVPAP